MQDRRRRAGGVEAEKQQRYLQLIAQGVSNAGACRLVGINRKTGTRRRYGRSVRNSVGELLHYPPVKAKEVRPRSPRYLSEHERIRIADLLGAGMTVRGIAAELGRAPSTISREIRRKVIRTGGIARTTQSTPPGSERASRASGASLSMPCWPTPSGDCWRSAGARSRSRTSCACCLSISRCAGYARSRSTRRSTTLRSRSRGRCGGAAADGGSWGCSGVDG